MSIGKNDKNGNRYYTFKGIPKIHILTEFFKYGFYIALVIWICGICFSTFYDGSVAIRITVIVVTLSIYIFFVLGKAVVDNKFGKE
ncbi:MAG: hypothetical protein HDQ97_12120 [Lachnospiraceae bacterium]|nr:hypothetical protein [Lachnospiraceae bacterium]